jgi:hypothetical protein
VVASSGGCEWRVDDAVRSCRRRYTNMVVIVVIFKMLRS